MDQAPEPPRSAHRFWLEYQGRTFELRPGEILIGRSSNCHLVLDDGLVSRRHAQFIVTDERASIEDFSSANGVFVNSKRVNGSEQLKAGDQLQIGKQQFTFCSVARPVAAVPAERRMAETLHGLRSPADPSLAPISDTRADTKSELKQPEIEATQRAEALELLGGVADKVLALGRGEEAERVLSTALNNVLNEAKRGREPAARVVSKAATYAGKLAEATSHGKWLDYTIDLYAALRRPMPIEFVDQMYAVLRRVDAVNLGALRAYLSILHAQTQAFAPNERFAIQRLEGLERLVALK
ncbi:MAG TPA: FHA domain-containing protein [Polyangiaceae bacterium]|nr:FHA domain-containing protein [Polyangiaceae bacterium]